MGMESFLPRTLKYVCITKLYFLFLENTSHQDVSVDSWRMTLWGLSFSRTNLHSPWIYMYCSVFMKKKMSSPSHLTVIGPYCILQGLLNKP
jgi:hypothetical protein